MRSGPSRVSCSIEQGPVLRQVAGQEDDEDDLEQLGRLAAERSELEGQALAVDLRAEDEGEQQQTDADRRPGVLVAAQPAVGPDDDAEGRRQGQRQQQPDELDLGQPELGAEERLGDEVLRQPLHQQQRDAAEQRHGRQQDLVGPPAGEDLGGVGGEEGGHVDRQPLRVVQRELAVDRRPERDAPDRERDRDQGQQPELEPARARADRSEDARERRRASGSGSRVLAFVTRALARAASGPGRSGVRRRSPSARRRRRAGR